MEIKVNGVSLYYEVRGRGKPLILVHGNGEDHSIFEEAVSLLQFYYTCYLFDSRGHGKSSKVDEFHYQDMANDYKEAIIQLGLEDVTFYGFSDGGIIGLLLASQTDLISDLIISGANTVPNVIKTSMLLLVKVHYFFTKSPLDRLMLEEPNITEEELAKIKIPVYILAGQKDVILEGHTYYIHEKIPNSKIKIIPKASHGSYIVHRDDIARIILEYKGIK